MRSKVPGSQSNVRLCAHLGPGFTLRSFLDGGHSFISVRTVLELENKGKGDQQQTFAVRSCLLFASDIPCKKRKPDHCPSSRKRHLQYRMCPPSHAPSHANSTLFSQTRVWQQHCRLCQTSHTTSLHMLLFVTARSVTRRIFATIAPCLSNLHQFILESQAAFVITTLERSRHATVVTSDGGSKLSSTQCPFEVTAPL